MKKYQKWIIMCTLCFVVSGCNNVKLDKENEMLKQQNESLTAEKESLSEQLNTVQEAYYKVNKELREQKESKVDEKENKALRKDNVIVEITEKTESPRNYYEGRAYPSCGIVFQITNNTDKDIQGIEGQLIVDDIFEKEIIRLNADLTGKVIEAGQTEIIVWLSYEVKPYEDDAVKFYSTAYEDLKFDYRISKIVFTDGSVKK